MKKALLKPALSFGLVLLAGPSWATGFETVTSSGTPVLKVCQGLEASRNPTLNVCKVTGSLPTTGSPGPFPGQTGTWTLVKSNSNQQVVANGATVGNMDDRVWRKNGTNDYIFGMRLQLSNILWTPPSPPTCPNNTPAYFEVNDMLRNGFASITAMSVAYKLGPAEEGAWLAGRTNLGLNQYTESPGGLNPTRNNDWVDFRTDVNFSDPDGTSFANSSWMFVAVNLPSGISTNTVASAIRVREGGEESQCQFQVNLLGYKPA